MKQNEPTICVALGVMKGRRVKIVQHQLTQKQLAALAVIAVGRIFQP